MDRNILVLTFLLHGGLAALDLLQSPRAALTTEWGEFSCRMIHP